MDKKEKKLELYRNLGVKLIRSGYWFLNHAFNIQKTHFSWQVVQKIVSEKTGLPPSSIGLFDTDYWTTDWETWKKLIYYDWTDKRKWLNSIWDCDNFADAFKVHMTEIYGLNLAGRFSVELLNPKTQKHIGWHRAAVILDKEKNLWLLETQTDKYVQIEKGKLPVIDNWSYKVHYISFN